MDRVKRGYQENRRILIEGLPQAGLDTFLPADGAFYLYADVSKFTSDSLAFTKQMLEEAHVAATSGIDFDPVHGRSFVRFSYARSAEDMREAVATDHALAEALARSERRRSISSSFSLEHIEVTDGRMRLRRGGSGPPLLLLHGNPQTHAMWNAVAPELAKRFTVICPDLRGYGGSLKPPATDDHAPYAKKAMAQGHGRGDGALRPHALSCRQPRPWRTCGPSSRARLSRARRETRRARHRADDRAFRARRHEVRHRLLPLVLVRPAASVPGRADHAAPETWFMAHTSRGGRSRNSSIADAFADYLACARNPEMIRGMCEDYRAAASIDLEHDRASRAAGAKIQCPLLVLWGSKGSDRPLVRSAGDLAAVLCGRGDRQRRQQWPLSCRGSAESGVRALPGVFRLMLVVGKPSRFTVNCDAWRK